jgi:hypothetical protein
MAWAKPLRPRTHPMTDLERCLESTGELIRGVRAICNLLRISEASYYKMNSSLLFHLLQGLGLLFQP